MSLNFQGIGFSFSAKDSGLLAYQKQVLSGFNSINDQVAKMGKGGGMKPPGGGGPGGGGPGGGGPGGGMPDIPDPSKKMGAWAQFGATVKKSMGGVFSSTKSANRELFGMADIGHKLRAILGQLRLGNLLEGLSLSNLNQITDAVEKLGASGRNLTTSLEGEFTAMGKTAKASFANLGYTGAEIGKMSAKASSMAKGLNLDVGVTTEAIAAYGWASEEFAALGIMNEKDLAKTVAVTGINAKETSQTIHKLSSAYGFTGDQIKQLYSSSVALGQQTGDVGASVGKLPAMMDKLAQTTDRYGNVLKGADLANFAQETLALSAGFVKMGYDSEEATSAAETFGEAISKGRKDYAGLFMGVGDQMPDFLQQLTTSTGGFADSFALMQEGPEGFAKGMLGMVDKVRASGEDVNKFVRTIGMRLDSTLGADKSAMLQKFMLKADESVLNVMADSKKATVTLGEVSKAGFTVARTLAESMQLAEDALEARFRKIGMSSTRTFVTDSQKNFKSFGDQMEHLAEAGGPMGMVVAKLSEISSQGATAFLPDSMKPAAALFGNLLSTIGPAFGILGSLGFRFGMLASPLALLAVPLGFLAILFGDLVMQSYDAETGLYNVEGAFWVLKDVVKDFFFSIPGYIDDAITYLQKFGDWLLEITDPSTLDLSGGGFFSTFLQMFEDMGTGGKLAKLGSTLFTVLKNVLSIAFTLIQSIPFTEIATGLGTLLLGGLNLAFDLLRAIPVGKIVKILSDVLTAGFNLLSSLPVGAITANLIEFAGRVFSAAADMPIGNMAGQFLDYFGRVLAATVSGFGQVAGILGPILSDVVTNAVTWVSGPGLAKGETIVADLAAGAVKAGGKLGDALIGIASTAGDALGKNIGPIFDKVFGAALNLTDAAMTLVMNLATSVGAALPALIPKIVSGMVDLVLAIGPALGKLSDVLQTSIGPKLSVGIKDLVAGFIKGLLPALVLALVNLPSMLWSILSGLGSILSGIVTLLGGVALGLFMGVFEGLFGIFGLNFEELALTFANWLDGLGTTFSTAWTAITTFFVGGWETLKNGVVAAFDGLTTWFSGWWEKLKTLFFGFVTPLGEVFPGVTAKAMEFFTGVSDKVKGVADKVRKLWETISNFSGKFFPEKNKLELETTHVRKVITPKFNMEEASKVAADPKPWSMTADATAATSSGMFNMVAALKPVADGTAGAAKAAGDFAAKTENAGVSVRDVNAAMSAMPMIFGRNKKKSEEYTKAFSDFVLGLKDIWYKGIDAMLQAMDLMVVAVQKDAASLNADVARMTAALIEIQREKEKTLSMTAAAGPPSILQSAGMEDLPTNFKALASVIDSPGWYARYEVLFALKMNELKVEIQRQSRGGGAAGGTPSSGPTSSSGARTTVAGMVKGNRPHR